MKLGGQPLFPLLNPVVKTVRGYCITFGACVLIPFAGFFYGIHKGEQSAREKENK